MRHSSIIETFSRESKYLIKFSKELFLIILDVEEYSCYAFPALKALEAFMLDLLYKKGIIISTKMNFGSIFIPSDTNPSVHVLNIKNRGIINDTDYGRCIEEIYNYFKQVRHVNFHANQILVMTSMMDNKFEADDILNKVVELIENTCSVIFK